MRHFARSLQLNPIQRLSATSVLHPSHISHYHRCSSATPFFLPISASSSSSLSVTPALLPSITFGSMSISSSSSSSASASPSPYIVPNVLRSSLLKGSSAVGTMIADMKELSVIQIMKNAGMDFVIIDNEVQHCQNHLLLIWGSHVSTTVSGLLSIASLCCSIACLLSSDLMYVAWYVQ